MNIHTKAKRFLEHDRYFYSHNSERNINGWYAETREGIQGPFNNRGLAKQYLSRLINSNPSRR